MKRNLIFSFLININSFSYVVLFLAISLIIGQITLFLPESAGNTEPILDAAVWMNLLFGIIIIPFFETLLFQSFIIELTCKLLKRPRSSIFIAVFLSSSAFALNHSYSYYYIAFTFFAGIILSLAYYFARYRRKDSPLVVVFIIHSVYNLFSYLQEYIYT